MAYHIQASFAAGELDPALHERTTFEKYQSGLKTLRNTVIGKTGRPTNRPGTLFDIETKDSSRQSILYSPPFTDYLIEWGHEYVRIHKISAGTYVESSHDFTESDLPNIQFLPSGLYVYIFLEGSPFKKMVLGDLDATDIYLDTRFVGTNEKIYTPLNPNAVNRTANTGTGHSVLYEVSFVYAGEESVTALANLAGNLPILNGEETEWDISLPVADAVNGQPDEVKVYRRPEEGIALGFVGNAVYQGITAGEYIWHFIDYGGDADYEHQPIAKIPAGGINGVFEAFINPRCGAVYQQRLIINEEFNSEALNASRTGFQNNFTRSFPLSDDSALRFRAGSSGSAQMLRLSDYNGLIAFTTVGIFQHTGSLVPGNLAMTKKGNWVIDPTVPPLEVPGAVLFVDKATNTVRELIFSEEAGGFPGNEISIFSNHLFVGKTIKSWAFQDGDIPIIWVVMSDGSLNALTYQREHQMQAWSHHDTDGTYESVTVVKNFDVDATAYFVVKRGNKRIIEKTSPRYVDNFKDIVLMDSAVTKKTQLNSAANITITAVDVEDWAGELLINSTLPIFTNTDNDGAVGTTYRFFDNDGSKVDLVVTTFTDTKNVTVQPAQEFPEDQGQEVTLYKTYTSVSGLDHLNGKFVSILSDGYVLASPLNDIENYPEVMVVNGQITLPGGRRGAFIHVGLPYASDVETLDIDTVEQRPALLESTLVSKIFLKVLNSRGLYVGPNFPVNDYVAGDPASDSESPMIDIETMTENPNTGIIGNAAQEPYTKRYYITVPNDWKVRGRICIRQVDPLPFEILSIIPDLTVLR